MSQQGVFFERLRKAPSRPPNPTVQTLAQWKAAWALAYGAPLRLQSQAAWSELRRQCKRLVGLVPDPAEREAFLDLYLQDRDRYLVEHQHPLRLALAGFRYTGLRTRAARVLANRPAGAPAAETKATAAPAALPSPPLPLFRLCFRNAAHVVIATATCRAQDADVARAHGFNLLGRYPTGVSFDVEPADGPA